eukprot:328179_1
MAHMKEIELLIGVYIQDEYDIEPPANQLSISIKHIDRTVYKAIKKEIGGIDKAQVSIDSLSVIQFIKTNWNHHNYQQHFLYFAEIFKLIRKYPPQGLLWTNANILPRLINMVNDHEINRRYAVCLSKLYHYDEAENIFKTLIKNIHNNRFCLHRIEYGYFLLKCARYSESYDQFDFVINNQIHDVLDMSRVYLPYAQTLEYMNKPQQAEKYYKLAMEVEAHQYHHRLNPNRFVSYKFAGFLYNQKRYEESIEQYTLVMEQNRKPYADNHFGIGKCFYELGMFKEYEYHLKRTLDVDPSFYDAKQALDKYYMNQQMTVRGKNDNNNGNTFKQTTGSNNDSVASDMDDEKTIISEIVKTNTVNNMFNIEFDRWWFDNLDIITDEFNKYYDNFVNNNMNDIRYILFTVDEKIQSELKTKIKVSSLQNMQLIMTSIQDLRVQYQDFITTLKKYKMYKYYTIFTENAIYTIKSLVDKVTRENDLSKFVKCYNESNKGATEQFNQNDDNLIGLLSSFVIECKQLLD